MRKPLSDAVVYELVTIKTRQPVVSAEPEKATRIRNNLVHAITRQSVSSSVSSNRKLFSAMLRAGNENEQRDGDHALHGADIIKQSGPSGRLMQLWPLCFLAGGVRNHLDRPFETPEQVSPFSCFIRTRIPLRH